MKIVIGLLGLAAVALALEHSMAPAKPSILIVDVPDPSAPPVEDLDLKGAIDNA